MKKGFEIKCLDHGYVKYIDHMGTDERILEAARVSYKSSSKGIEADKKLLHYLWKNKHCYHPDMEVLTIEGWKKWKNCKHKETYVVPNPNTRKYSLEQLSLEIFETDEAMYSFNNERMSYLVSENHRMWFKNKNDTDYKIVRVQDKNNWGHFEPITGYCLHDKKGSLETRIQYFELVGFYLGDGYRYSANKLGFRLKKPRKVQYLEEIFTSLNISFDKFEKELGIIEYRFDIPKNFQKYVDITAKAADKQFYLQYLNKMGIAELQALQRGLINSDGSLKKSRQQIEFGSASKKLTDLFNALASFFGYDAHYCMPQDGMLRTIAYSKEGRTSLESRAGYHSRVNYKGKIYCTTTSTGLLVVRGGPDKFAFICGNTSPFEMCKITFNIKMPVFCMRQYVRHRMQNLNEVSARYTEVTDEFYFPETWRKQDTKNKQGSILGEKWDPILVPAIPATDINHVPFPGQEESATDLFKRTCAMAYSTYKELLEAGVAREMARMVLPVNIYTEIYCCWDLKNLLHFITLRDDSHAQYEIQVYARAMKDICKELFPWTMEAFEKYKFKLIEE